MMMMMMLASVQRNSFRNARQPFRKRRLSSSSSPSTSIFAKAWEAYTTVLSNRPLVTKASMAAVIFFTSDSAAQYMTRQDDENDDDDDDSFSLDVQRALSGSVFGIVAATFLHNWWGFLERLVGARLPISTHRLSNTLTKVVIDQGVGAPFYIYSYYVVTNFLQTLAAQPNGPDARSTQQIWKETHDKASHLLWPTMLRHWRLWPFIHSFNFYFVPIHHRVLVQNLVLVGWSGYLSHLNGGGLETPKQEIEDTEAVVEHRQT